MAKYLSIHYHRYDHDYEEVSLWVWPEGGGPGHEVQPTEWDNFGPRFDVDLDHYFPDGHVGTIGMIPRLRGLWKYKDGDDRHWHSGMGHEVWILGNDAHVYTSEPDISPCIQVAYLDSRTTLSLQLSHTIMTARLKRLGAYVSTYEGERVDCELATTESAFDGRTKSISVTLKEEVSPDDDLMVHMPGFRSISVKRRGILFNPQEFFYEGELGPVYTKEHTTFRLFAPEADNVCVVLYDAPYSIDGRTVIEMNPIGSGVWETTVKGDLHERCYRVVVDSPDPATGSEVLDPYVKMATGHDGHGMVVDLKRLNPEGFDPRKRPPFSGRPVDAIIAEFHLRDFSIAPSSGVPEHLRGHYLGAVEPGTRIPGTDIATCLDHLVEMGVTHVQLLPIIDFDNVESKGDYSWGFMPSNFFSPEGWFASRIDTTCRILEAKEMIQKLHDRGIRVILDVIFNHTAPNAPFESIVPNYYHRRRDDGSFWNGSQCGNEFRTEAPMARKLIHDACRYWVEEFGIDGFRFDIMGLIDLDTLLELREHLVRIDPTLLIIGEPWVEADTKEVGIHRITSRFMISGTGISGFNDHYRNDLKGDPSQNKVGYLFDGSNRDGMMRGIQGGIYDWTWHPSDAVQYISSHANLTLWDKIAATVPELPEEDWVRLQKLALGILLVSQGCIFLHSGVEFARTKSGNPNSYDAPDETNRIDWERKQAYSDLYQWTVGLIALRKAHAIFRLHERTECENRLHFHSSPKGQPNAIVFTLYGGELEGETWQEVLIIINPYSYAGEYELQPGLWTIVAQDGVAYPDGHEDRACEKHKVPARSITIMATEM